MKKKAKKRISILTACIFLISSLGMTAAFGYTSTPSQLLDTYSGLELSSNGESLHKAPSSNGMTFAYGESQIQKPSDDSVYQISGTASSTMRYVSHGSNYIAPFQYITHLGNQVAASSYSRLTLQFDFLLNETGTGLFFRLRQTNSSGATDASKTLNIFFTTGCTAQINDANANVDVTASKWHRAAIDFGTNGEEENNTLSVYLDGNLVSTIDTFEDYSTGANIAWLLPYVAAGGNYNTYYDNIKIFGGDEYTPSDIPSVSATAYGNYDDDLKTITVDDSASISEIVSNLTLSSNALGCIVLNQDGTLFDTTETIGESDLKLAVYSDDGGYNYYTITSPDYYLKTKYDGASFSSSEGTSVNMFTQIGSGLSMTAAQSAPFKNDDVAYNFSGTTTTGLSNGTCYLRPGVEIVTGNTSKYKYTSFSYDVFFETDLSGMFYRFKQYSKDNPSTMFGAYNIYVGTGIPQASASMLTQTIVTKNEWHRVSIVYGSNGEAGNNMVSVYLDGELNTQASLTSGGYGTTTVAPNGYFCLNAAAGAQYEAYLDNVSVYVGKQPYTGGECATINSISSTDYELTGNIITAANRKTVADLVDSIQASGDATIEVYSQEKELKENSDNLASSDIVILKSTDGIYSYYYIYQEDLNIYSLDGSENITLGGTDGGLSLSCDVKNVMQRDADDSAFYLSGTTTSSLEQLYHGKNYINLNLGTLVGSNPSYKYMTVEFDFLLETEGTGVTFRMKQENTSAASFLNFTAGNEVHAGEWNRAAITYCVNGEENLYSLYLNGHLYDEGNTPYGSMGVSNVISAIVPIAASGIDYGLYLDNINVHKGTVFASSGSGMNPISVVSNSEYTVDSQNLVLGGVKPTDTVSSVLDEIFNPEKTYRKFIVGTNFSELSSQSTIPEGGKLVVINNDGIYTYYNIEMILEKLSDKTGTETLATSENMNGLTVQSGVTNVPMRDANDSAFRVSGTSTSNMTLSTHTNAYIDLGYQALLGDFSYNKFVMQIDFMIKNANTGFWFACKQKNAESASRYLQFVAGDNVKAGEWNRAAIVYGADGIDSTYKIYLNGTLITSGLTTSGAYGIDSGTYILPYAANDSNYDVYYDNIVMYAGVDTYEAGNSPEITGFGTTDYVVDGENKKISNILTDIAIDQLKDNAVTTENGIIKVYNSELEEKADTETLLNEDIVAVIGNNGIYEYYTIEKTAHYPYSSNITNSLTSNLMTYNGDFEDVTSIQQNSYANALALSGEHGSGWFATTNNIASRMAVENENGNKILAFNTLNVNWDGAFYVLPTERISSGNYTLSFDAKLDSVNTDHAYIALNLTYLYYESQAAKEAGTLKKTSIATTYRKVAAGASAATNSTVTVNNTNWQTYTVNYDLCNALNAAGTQAIDPSLIAAVVLNVTQNWDKTEAYPYGTRTDVPVRVLMDNFSLTGPESFTVESVKSDDPLTLLPLENNEIGITFSSRKIYADSVNSNNIYFTDESGNRAGTIAFSNVYDGSYVAEVRFSVSGLSPFTNYTLNAKDIRAYNPLSGDDTKTFGEGDYKFATLACPLQKPVSTLAIDDGTDRLMSNMVDNSISDTGWIKQGYFTELSSVYDETLQENVVYASNRTSYTQGVQQLIYYDEFFDNTGDVQGDVSAYKLSFKIKSDTDQKITVALKWYINGVDVDAGSDSESIITSYESLTAGEWQTIDKELMITVPKSIETATSAYLRIYIIGNRSGVDLGSFSVADFSLCKWYSGTNQNLTLDDTDVIGQVSQNALGYAYEAGNYWYTESAGGTVSATNRAFKPSYLNYANGADFKLVRIGGYSSNYELWKRDIGPVSQRVKYAYPKARMTQLTYSLATEQYIGMLERVQLAKSFNPNAKMIFCLNIWSAEPNAENMADETGSAPNLNCVYPVKVMRNLNEYGGAPYNETIDEVILAKAINNALDLIRFWRCEVDDPRAIGSDGTNWAQVRVNNGYEDPIDVECWELGNELYIRHLSPEGYVNLAQRFITAINAVFPEEKLGVHTTSASFYPNWTLPIVEGLGTQVDYITTHNYYTYANAGTAATSGNKVMIDAIKATNNSSLKFLVTEGGLNTFDPTYTGPTTHSIAMPLSFADYFNNIVKADCFEGFQYYGSTGQLTYNTGSKIIDGWSSSLSKISEVYDAQLDENVYEVTEREVYTSGIQNKVSLNKFEDELQMQPGDKANFNFSLKYKIIGDSSYNDTVNIKMHWVINDVNETNNIYSATLSSQALNEWHTINLNNISIKIPDAALNAQSAYLRVAIHGSTSSATQFCNVRVKDISLIKAGNTQNIADDVINMGDIANDSFHDTALLELMKYYFDNCTGNIVSTTSSSNAIAKLVSTLAVKTDTGVRLFLSNLSNEKDFVINLNSDKNYKMTKKFTQTADSTYAERTNGVNDITTTIENYNTNDEVTQITIPKTTVMVIDLTDITPAE